MTKLQGRHSALNHPGEPLPFLTDLFWVSRAPGGSSRSLGESSPAGLHRPLLEGTLRRVSFLTVTAPELRVSGDGPGRAIFTTAVPFLRVFYEPPCDRRVLGEIKIFWGRFHGGNGFPKSALRRNKNHAEDLHFISWGSQAEEKCSIIKNNGFLTNTKLY